MEQKHIAHKMHENKFDVIPAFLTPDHITTQHDNIHQTTRREDDSPSDMVVRERLYYAIERQHIDLFMQPIVTLPQRHIAFYEFFGRLRVKAGQYVAAHDYMDLANEEHIVSNLDAIFLTQCLKVLKKQQDKTNRFASYFINIKPFTLRNKDFMKNLVAILSKHKEIAHSLIFEMHYNDFLMLSPAEKKILSGLSKIGCRFSLDHMTDIPADIEHLKEQNISFIKIDAKNLIIKGGDKKGFDELLSQKQRLQTHNINLIIEKIESEANLIELLDYNIKYGQGFLFGKPDFAGVYA